MAECPVESGEEVELETIRDYDTMKDVPKENGSNTISSDPSEKLLNASLSEPEDSGPVEVAEERAWVKLCPWLLKWSWFRNRRYKTKNGKSQCICIFFS